MLRDQKVSIPAGQKVQLFVNADYLRIKTANIPFRFSTSNGDDFEIKQGDEVSINNFEYVYIKNESANDEIIDLFTGKNERVGSAELSGNVIVVNNPDFNGEFTHLSGNFTNVNAGVLVASPNRRYLFIQNNDPLQVLRVNFGGAASAVAGLRLKAGESYECTGFCTTSAISVCYEAATGAGTNNVEVITG